MHISDSTKQNYSWEDNSLSAFLVVVHWNFEPLIQFPSYENKYNIVIPLYDTRCKVPLLSEEEQAILAAYIVVVWENWHLEDYSVITHEGFYCAALQRLSPYRIV
jgi:hypothetical protein